MSGDLFRQHALAQIPKILTLQDRNPHSPTFGCFDRNFWHYRTIDFPTGMAQEFVWPLALALRTDTPDNPYFGIAAVREWVEAGLRFAMRNSRSDGSCDDFYPFERAVGAAAFSLLACIESYALIGLEDAALVEFFGRRGAWLAGRHESGRLSNHEALIVLCLDRLAGLTGTTKHEAAIARRTERLLSWQHPEGWFWEYEGCDVGYQTLTLSLLARLQDRRPEPRLKQALERGVRFVAEFVHPDGSFGGEYGSRNTYNFFPHGFELVGAWMPEALAINDRFLAGMAAGRAPCYADDHIIGHHAWNYLLAAQDFVAERPANHPANAARRHYPGAGLLIDRRGGAELYIALNKGGVFKLFRDGRLVVSDTQLSFEIAGRRRRTAVCHMIDRHKVTVESDTIAVSGHAAWAKQRLMRTADLVLLRLFMLAFGRWFPDLVRRIFQRMLITDRQRAPIEFRRELHWQDGAWRITDEARTPSWADVLSAGISGHATSIFVIQSRTYQAGQLQPWHDLTSTVRRLGNGQPLVLERRF